MSEEPYIHPERINDRAKLLRHRVVAHYLRRHPELIEKAKEFQAAQKERGYKNHALFEWDEILNLPIDKICKIITSRSEDSYRLRISSPLGVSSGLFFDPSIRKRIMSLSKKGLYIKEINDLKEQQNEVRSFP